MTRKRKSKKSSGGHDALDGFLMLAIFLIVFMAIFFIGEPTIDAIPLFHILMTLGGLESYDNTVIGVTIILMMLGIIVIFEESS